MNKQILDIKISQEKWVNMNEKERNEYIEMLLSNMIFV